MHLDGCHNRVAVLAGGKRIAALGAGIYIHEQLWQEPARGFFFTGDLLGMEDWRGNGGMMNVGDVEVVCVEHQMMAKMKYIPAFDDALEREFWRRRGAETASLANNCVCFCRVGGVFNVTVCDTLGDGLHLFLLKCLVQTHWVPVGSRWREGGRGGLRDGRLLVVHWSSEGVVSFAGQETMLLYKSLFRVRTSSLICSCDPHTYHTQIRRTQHTTHTRHTAPHTTTPHHTFLHLSC